MSNDWMNGFGKKAGCHTGNPVVFEAMGVKVHAGGHSRNGGWHRMDPTPDLAMGPAQVMDKGSRATTCPEHFTCAAHVQVPPIISIDWPDFDIPQDIGRDWWLALVADIKRTGVKSVSTQCVGGHGRTGVQLAILAHLMGATEQPDANALIKWVRSNYCSHAVETFPQQEYVAECCDIPVGERLFAAPKKKSSALTFADNDYPAPAPKSVYWGDDDVLEGTGDMSIPKGFSLFGCHECGNMDWLHLDDESLPCTKCGCPDMMPADDVLYDAQAVCVSCDAVVTQMALCSDGRCMECHAKDRDAKTRNGDVQCGKCKRYYIPEVINEKTFHCVSCERKATQKPKAKGKGKRKGKKTHKPVPKGGLKGKDLFDFVGFQEDNC